MSNLPLSRTDAAFLIAAAERGDKQIVLPATMKPVSAQRLISRLLKHALVAAGEEGGVSTHHLTSAGYTAIGLKPPRARRAPIQAGEGAIAGASVEASKVGTKRDLVLTLLRRPNGASSAELIAATGWLAHTTRAALSRLRSAGQTLEKSVREDGATAYRIPDRLVSGGRAEAVPLPVQPSLKPGTLLVREWKGELQQVVILDTGFAWNGTTYDSLSKVAHAITGTNWNGPRFFGLRSKPSPTLGGARP